MYSRSTIGKVVAVDLPGHGPRAMEDAAHLSLDDFVSELTQQVRTHELRNLVMAGHGMAAPIVLRAAAMLEEPPRSLVLFAGVIPDEGKSALDTLPRSHRLVFKVLARLNAIARKKFGLPKAVITNLYCNGMDPFDVIQIVGRFGQLPVQLLRAGLYLDDIARICPITYVPLWRDGLFSSDLQRQMAERLGRVEITGELDSCHEVMIEQPKQVANILLRNAEMV